jgi:hypothetical protein
MPGCGRVVGSFLFLGPDPAKSEGRIVGDMREIKNDCAGQCCDLVAAFDDVEKASDGLPESAVPPFSRLRIVAACIRYRTSAKVPWQNCSTDHAGRSPYPFFPRSIEASLRALPTILHSLLGSGDTC